MWQAIRGGILIAMVMVPVIITIMVLTGYRGFVDLGFSAAPPKETGPEIRCLAGGEQCFLRIRGKWYVVVDVLDEQDVPIKFRIDPEDVIVEDTLSVTDEETPNQ